MTKMGDSFVRKDKISLIERKYEIRIVNVDGAVRSTGIETCDEIETCCCF